MAVRKDHRLLFTPKYNEQPLPVQYTMAGRNLIRGTLKRNPKHVRNGLKSYVHALHKWNICPTVQGPYCTVKKASQQAKFGGKVGGRVSFREQVLAKKDASGQTGEVPVRYSCAAAPVAPHLTRSRPKTLRTTQSTSLP